MIYNFLKEHNTNNKFGLLYNTFSMWCLNIYILLSIFKYYGRTNSDFFTNIDLSIKLLVCSCSIFGTYIMEIYRKQWGEYYKVSDYCIFLSNLIIHILPLIYIITNIKKYSISNNNKIVIVLYSSIFSIIYLSKYNLKEIYPVVRYTHTEMIMIYIIIYFLSFFITIGCNII